MQKGEFQNLNNTLPMEDDADIKASHRHPYLVIFIGKDKGKRHKLKPGTLTIGRSPQADIGIDDDRISRIHCEIKWSDGTFTIKDMGSKNGTYVDSSKISKTTLSPGVLLQLGHSVMKIDYKDKAEIQYEKSLMHRVSTDGLTGIYNRRHFFSLASKEMSYARRHQQTVAIILISVDNLNRINEIYGRSIGDLVLIKLADLISERKRAEDLFGRYGGNRFIILPRGKIDRKSIHRQCERIREDVEMSKFCYAEECVQIKISIGYDLDRPANGKAKTLLDNLIDMAEQSLHMDKVKSIKQTHEYF